MNPVILYDRLAEVSDELSLAIDRVTHMTDREKLVFEALWVRLDDLVEQLPETLRQEALNSAEAEQEEG